MGNKKQLAFVFFISFLTTFLWDNFAVLSGHWEYKNVMGLFLWHSPVENVSLAFAYPVAVITSYQVFEKNLGNKK